MGPAYLFMHSTLGLILVSNGNLGWDGEVRFRTLKTNRWDMQLRAMYVAFALFLLHPAGAKAQSLGQIDCPRAGGYVYLYSSMTTLDVRTTVQCGEQVQITGQYQGYFGVRTAKGDDGYIPQNSVRILRDKTGPLPLAQRPARPRTPYDDPNAPAEDAANYGKPSPEFTLRNNTPIHVKVMQTLSSTSTHLGDKVQMEVVDDVVVDGLLVIAKGAAAAGSVTEVSPKKRMGHGGVVGVSVSSVRLSNNADAAVRGYHEARGEDSATASVLPMVSGKDVALEQGTVFTASIDGDVKLQRDAFQEAKANAGPGAVPSAAAQNPPQ
jgi:hypothetical protein